MAKIIIKQEGFECERCGHQWISNKEMPVTCPKCFPKNTIISGNFKNIEDLNINDKVFSLDGDETIVKQKFQHNYNGKLIEIKCSGCLPIQLTPEHKIYRVHVKQQSASLKRKFQRFFFKPELIEANSLKKRCLAKNINGCGDYLIIPKIKGNFQNKQMDLSIYTNKLGQSVARGKNVLLNFPINNNSAWMMGLYVAEGCSSKRGEIKFSLGTKRKVDLVKQLKKRLKKLSLNFTIYPIKNEKCVSLTIYSRLLARAFREWFGENAKNKRVPYFIMQNKDKNIIKNFLKGYILGDGHIRKDECRIIINMSTVSKVLALQLQLLAIRLNDFLNITSFNQAKNTHFIQNRRIKGGMIYLLRTNAGIISKLFKSEKKPRHNKSFKFFKNFVAVPINNIKYIRYKGKVYNLETKTGDYLAFNFAVKNCKSPYFNTPRKNKQKKQGKN